MSLKDFLVYQFSIEFLTLADQIAESLPRGYSELKDQLKRSSLSIVLNIAEGAGNYYPAQQKRHYIIARGSAFECYAAIEVIKVLKLGDSQTLGSSLRIIDNITSILSRLCNKV